MCARTSKSAQGWCSWWCCSRTMASMSIASRPEGIRHRRDTRPATRTMRRRGNKVANTLLVALGATASSRRGLILMCRAGGSRNFRYRLIPSFADAIKPDPDVSAAIAKARRHMPMTLREVGRTRSCFSAAAISTDVSMTSLCGLLKERDDKSHRLRVPLGHERPARPGDNSGTYPQCDSDHYAQVDRISMTGERLKEVLEDVADNSIQSRSSTLTNRAGTWCVAVASVMQSMFETIGQRISAMNILKFFVKAIEPKRVCGRWLGQRQ